MKGITVSVDIEQQYTDLCLNLVRLKQLLATAPVKQAVVSETAPTLKGHDSEPIDSILISPVNGLAACELAAKTYNDLLIHADYSQKCARRTIGALWLAESDISIEISALVDSINACKLAIKTKITDEFATHSDRFNELRKSCPGVMTVHLYRQIRCYDHKAVRSVRFTWLRKETVSKVKLHDLLEKIHNEIRLAREDEYRQLSLTQLATRVASVPEAQLRTRRATPVQPMANFRWHDRTFIQASPMPFIIIQPEPVEIKMLKTYQAGERRKVRSDKRESEVIGYFAGQSVEVFPA
jgi:DNA replication terminus site-binding protein